MLKHISNFIHFCQSYVKHFSKKKTNLAECLTKNLLTNMFQNSGIKNKFLNFASLKQ